MTSTFNVKVTPRSSKNAIIGWEEGVLKVRLRAIPDKGAANEMLINFLAEELDLSKSKVKILSGHTSRIKRLEVAIDREELLKRLPPE